MNLDNKYKPIVDILEECKNGYPIGFHHMVDEIACKVKHGLREIMLDEISKDPSVTINRGVILPDRILTYMDVRCKREFIDTGVLPEVTRVQSEVMKMDSPLSWVILKFLRMIDWKAISEALSQNSN